MNNISNDVLFEIVSYLDVLSCTYLLSTSRRFRTIFKSPQIIDRIHPYQNYIKYKQWNKGLMEATKKNDFVQAQFFIEKGADNVPNALIEASRKGNIYLVMYYLKYVGMEYISYVFCFGCEGGHKQLTDLHIFDATLDTLSKGLACAARGGHAQLMRDIVTQMHTIDRKPPRRTSMCNALVEAVLGGNQEAIDLCIMHGADKWDSALDAAIRTGNKHHVQYFLKKNNQKISKNSMQQAARSGKMEMVQWVIQRGLNNWDDGLMGATEAENRDLVDFFLNKGAKNWNSAIWKAAYQGNMDLVDLFYQKGINRMYLNTALQYAVISDQIDIVMYLVDKGADCWNEALHEAAVNGHVYLAEFFIKKGATELKEALIAACQNSSFGVIELLLKRLDLSEQEITSLAECAKQHLIEKTQPRQSNNKSLCAFR